MVSLGLCSVFELLRETQSSHPSLCHRALLALLNILQAQTPEALRNEPADIVGMSWNLTYLLTADNVTFYDWCDTDRIMMMMMMMMMSVM